MREYKRYDEYKDSGIEWIGEIPDSWKLIRFKYLFSYQKGNSPNEYVAKSEGIPYLSMDYLRGNNDEITYVRNDPNMVKVEYNQILLLWDGSNSGEFIKSKKGLLSSTMSVITDIKLDKNFSFYYFKASEKYLRDQTIGMGIPHVDSKILKNIYFTVPKKKLQQKIASFLDIKTTEIDEIIKKKESLIDYLEKYKKSVITEAVTKGKLGDKYITEDGELVDEIEMKDSGVEWIGEIPEYSNVIPFKRISIITSAKRVHEKDYRDKGIPFYRSKEIVRLSRGLKAEASNYISQELFNQIYNRYGIPKKGDLLITSIGTIGQVWVCDGRNFYYKDGNITQIILESNNYINSKFIKYCFDSSLIKKQYEKMSAGSTLQALTIEKIKELLIIQSDKNTKEIIINYLDNKIQKINLLIQKTKESIEKYKEYKKSLIFEAVTGKIDLRDYELKGGEELAEYNNSSETERERISAVD